MRGFHLILSVLCILEITNVFGAPTTETTQPTVETKQGQLTGKYAESRNGRRFVQYLGIPYAQKPQRFQEAGPPEKWTGVRDGTKFGQPCAQFDRKTKGVVGSEDCLFLNVYTPVTPTSKTTGTTPKPPTAASKTSTTTVAPSKTSPPVPPRKSKLPVLVYIHGGSFVSQSGHLFGGKYFMDQDVLLVTLNYRLGVLGFLSTGDSDSIANLGLRDQIMALKWIKENIEAFGGDPSRVVLVGGSAGGAMASYLMLSPLAKGLFSGVISQSGNALCPWVIVRKPQQVAQKLAAKLNCPPTTLKSSKDIMTCIKGKSLKDIEIARVALQGFTEDPAVPFAPVVEKWAKDKAVVPDTPQKLLAEGKAALVPWLTGYNSLNGLNLAVANILITPARLEKLDKEWNKLAPLLFHYGSTAQSPANVSADIRQYYFGSGRIGEENKEKLVIALTDRNFIHCTAHAALAQSKYAPVYLYSLNHQGANSFLDEWGVRDKIKMRGVVHNDELPYLFNIGLQSLSELKKGDKNTAFSEKMVKIWTEFAKTGKPAEKTDGVERVWTPVQPSQSVSSLQWYELDSISPSHAAAITAPTFKVWDSMDLGEETVPSNYGKFAVGHTMPKNPAVNPITHSPAGLLKGTTSPPSLLPSSTFKSQLNVKLGSSTVGYDITPKPNQGGVPSSSTTLKPTSSAAPPKVSSTTTEAAPIQVLFKEDDRPSSTTTTTTKKPGFFSKLIG